MRMQIYTVVSKVSSLRLAATDKTLDVHLSSDDDLVREAREQTVLHYSGNAVDGVLQLARVGDGREGAIQNPIAVVGDERLSALLTKRQPGAETFQVNADQRSGERNGLHRYCHMCAKRRAQFAGVDNDDA